MIKNLCIAVACLLGLAACQQLQQQNGTQASDAPAPPPALLSVDDVSGFRMTGYNGRQSVEMKVVPGKEGKLVGILNELRKESYDFAEYMRRSGATCVLTVNDGCMYDYHLEYTCANGGKGSEATMLKTCLCTYSGCPHDVEDCFTADSWHRVRRQFGSPYNRHADKRAKEAGLHPCAAQPR